MKKIKKIPSKIKENELNKQKHLIELAMADGQITIKQIANRTGVKIRRVQYIFEKFPELYDEYKLNFNTINDMAVDNMYSIINNKKHPRNWEATKFLIQSYKTEFDKVMTPKNEDTEIEIGNGSSAPPITITFKHKEKEEEVGN